MDRILAGLAQSPPTAQTQDLRTKANEVLKRIKEATKK
jgi:hypothetical protein